jgi:hypothetical protein
LKKDVKTPIIFLVAILAFVSVAWGAELGDLTWDACNLDKLRAYDKAAVHRFLLVQLDTDAREFTEDDFVYDWIPAEKGHYRLAVTSQTGPDAVFLTIYQQEPQRKFTGQEFDLVMDQSERWYSGPQFVDLDGDGEDELILFDHLDHDRYRGKLIPDGTWPRVYRLRNGKYVEASRDFPQFYEKQILPQLDKEISKAAKNVAVTEAQPPRNGDPDDSDFRWPRRYWVALIMGRDKILRVIGRDPGAGLDLAREWTTNSDPVLVEDAKRVFDDIGGHAEDIRAANLALKNATEHWRHKEW